MLIEVKAKIYSDIPGQTATKCYANVNIGGVLCINSYTVSNKFDYTDKLFAFPPSYKSKTGFKPYIEFPNNRENPLSTAIYKACISAYKHFEETGRRHEYGESYYVDLDNYLERHQNSINNNGHQQLAGTAEEISLSDVPF